MILELKGIYKDYQQGKMIVPVLKDVNFSMEEGEYVAIMGPSGSGKSTLMNIIGCLDQATKGTFFLDGQDISKCSENEMSDIRLNKIGFVFQSFHLMPRETAVENVSLPLSYAGVKKKERRERAIKALERVGLGDRVDFRPTQLSGGQKQRLAIARAIAKNPKICIFDDSFSALDLKTDAALRGALSENVTDSTIIIVAQRISTILHAEQILVLDEGRIVGKGTHEELLEHCEVYRQIAESQLSASELGMEESEVTMHE